MPGSSGASASLIQTIKTELSGAGYTVRTGVPVGEGPAGTKFKAKIIANYAGNLPFLVSCHSQSGAGTTENKVPFDVIAHATVIEANPNRFSGAYIVLDGTGWARKNYYVNGGLDRFMKNTEKVTIVSLEQFRERLLERSL